MSLTRYPSLVLLLGLGSLDLHGFIIFVNSLHTVGFFSLYDSLYPHGFLLSILTR